MADLTPSRIEPLGGSSENQPENSNRKKTEKPKASEKSPSAPPSIDIEKDESHQLDEQA